MRRRFGREALAIVALAAIACLGASASDTAAARGGLRLAKVATLDAPALHGLGSRRVEAALRRRAAGKDHGHRQREGPQAAVRRSARAAFSTTIPSRACTRSRSIRTTRRIGGSTSTTSTATATSRSTSSAVASTTRPARTLARAATMITVSHPNAVFENGGQLQFGPDGFLYIGTGDGENAGVTTPGGNSQDTDSLLGKLLRIDPKPGGGYDIPSTNPFGGASGRPEIYATGLRNPYRFSFDQRGGDLYLADVGDSRWEEINRVSSSRSGRCQLRLEAVRGKSHLRRRRDHAAALRAARLRVLPRQQRQLRRARRGRRPRPLAR